MIEVLLILAICAAACSVLGVFLVLRNLSMVSDAISHSILLGIVLVVLVVRSLTSVWLIIGAAVFGLITVYSIELLIKTKLIKSDASVGIVFPLFFSIGVILITRYGKKVHLSTDCIIMGEILFARYTRMDIFGMNLPVSLVHLSIMLLINLAFIFIFYKELKLSSFDPEYSFLSGFKAGLLSYGLMSLASLTTVIAFNAVGAILVIAFLITPAATATLVTKDLKYTILFSILFALLSSVLGYSISIALNISMSGTTAFVMGIVFVLVILFNKNGLIVSVLNRNQQRRELLYHAFLVHLSRHADQREIEHGLDNIKEHLNWPEQRILKCSRELSKRGLIHINKEKNYYELSDKGQQFIKQFSL